MKRIMIVMAVCLLASTGAGAVSVGGYWFVTLDSITQVTLGSDPNWYEWKYTITSGTLNRFSHFYLSGAAAGTFGTGGATQNSAAAVYVTPQTPEAQAPWPAGSNWTVSTGDTFIGWADFSVGTPGTFRFLVRAGTPQVGNVLVSSMYDQTTAQAEIRVPGVVQPIPEPVFFQMGALMGLSGLGLLRLRRKA